MGGYYMYHNYEVGNYVKSSNGQIMKIVSLSKNPFDGSLSNYVVCEWEDEQKRKQKRRFHIDELEFVSVGDAKGFWIE